MYEKRTQLKGSHYSECVDENGFIGKKEKKLEYFPRYTKEQCRQECMLKNVLGKTSALTSTPVTSTLIFISIEVVIKF